MDMSQNRAINTLINRRLYVIQYLLLVVLLTIQYNSYSSILSNSSLLFLLKTEFIVVFLYTIFLSARISGYMSVYTLFLTFSFLFNYSRIFLDYFSSFTINDGDLFNWITLSNSTVVELIYLVLFYLLSATIAFLIFYKKKELCLPKNNGFVNLGKNIIYLLAIPSVIMNILVLKFILSQGYLALFNGEVLDYKYSWIGNVLARLNYFGYLLFLSGIPDKKQFMKVTRLFLVIIFISALKGQRGGFLLLLIYSIWYYHNIYGFKFNLRKAFKISTIVLVFSQFIVVFRSNVTSKLEVLNIPYEFLKANGVSLLVPAYLIEYKTSFVNNGTPYLFTPIYDYFYRIFIDSSVFYEGRTDELLKVSNYLSNQLIYFINSYSYYAGFGTGTSYLAEFYDLGGLFFGSFYLFILVLFVMKWEVWLFSNRIILFLSPIVVTRFLYMPRDSFFKIVNDIFLLLVVYYVFNFFIKTKLKKS